MRIIAGSGKGHSVRLRPSGIELLAYLGVVVALIGMLTLVYTSQIGLSGVGAVTATLGAAALIAAYTFMRIGRRSALRAAGAI